MAYAWRGLGLDISRSFFGPDVLARLIERISDLGLNRLHLHLSDDQGWRIEIPARPTLTEISGATAVAGGDSGFLTVRDYEKLVKHADSRGIVIVPEIDLPGHVNAALHAYPELNPAGIAPDAYDGTEVGLSRFFGELPETEEFLRDVLGTVAELTPGEWLHIGGDECPLLSPEDYSALVRMAAGIVAEHGKKPIAWQEGAAAGLGPELILQYWRPEGTDEVEKMVEQIESAGADVILSPASHVYFDMKHSADDPVGADWAGPISVEKVQSWNPADSLPIDPVRILGVEAMLWTEFVHTEADLDRQLFPRLEYFAEIANR